MRRLFCLEADKMHTGSIGVTASGIIDSIHQSGAISCTAIMLPRRVFS